MYVMKEVSSPVPDGEQGQNTAFRQLVMEITDAIKASDTRPVELIGKSEGTITRHVLMRLNNAYHYFKYGKVRMPSQRISVPRQTTVRSLARALNADPAKTERWVTLARHALAFERKRANQRHSSSQP